MRSKSVDAGSGNNWTKDGAIVLKTKKPKKRKKTMMITGVKDAKTRRIIHHHRARILARPHRNFPLCSSLRDFRFETVTSTCRSLARFAWPRQIVEPQKQSNLINYSWPADHRKLLTHRSNPRPRMLERDSIRPQRPKRQCKQGWRSSWMVRTIGLSLSLSFSSKTCCFNYFKM